MENQVDQNSSNINPSTTAPNISLPASSSLPFPELVVSSPSAKTVALLKNALFSRNSENTAISTYLFQEWTLNPNLINLSKALEQIAVVEMTHLDAIANAIVSFGGCPNYSNADGAYWSGIYVNQNTNPNTFLKENIKAEQKVIEYYEYIISQTDNLSLHLLLEKIIADEKTHIAIFEFYLNQLS